MANQDYIGRSMEYPLLVANGSAKVITGNAVIEVAIRRILGIRIGELPHNPAFGSKLYLALFERNNDIAISLCKTYIKEACSIWLRRAQVMSIDTQVGEDNELLFNITYKVLATNQIGSFVYPFYRELEY